MAVLVIVRVVRHRTIALVGTVTTILITKMKIISRACGAIKPILNLQWGLVATMTISCQHFRPICVSFTGWGLKYIYTGYLI